MRLVRGRDGRVDVLHERRDMPRHLLAAGRRRCLLYTSDAADERSSVDLGGRRIIKKKTKILSSRHCVSRVDNR